MGGLLIFGKEPEKYLPQNGVSFAHFKGNEITDELIDKKIITGRLQDIAEQLLVVFKNKGAKEPLLEELGEEFILTIFK